ncbi:MAG: DEAD/DEAH box helicase [Myxococcales bacterium]|nr:DEAD/DEAH box helicase [Myxococcales bacterium]
MNAEAAIPLALAVRPTGDVRLDPHPAEIVAGPVARAFLADLELGPAYALLQLAARHPGEPLPPSLGFFRDLGALYLSAVCRQRSPVPPADELERRAASAPPIAGGEYLTAAVLHDLWRDLDRALEADLEGDDLAGWLGERNPAWNVVGRIVFHLAENKADSERPFAFLATYTTRLSKKAEAQHRPLALALRDFAGDKAALLALLLPVQRAAQRSGLVKDLVGDGRVYGTLAWSADEAHRFLLEVPALEEAGIVVRVPDWWKKRSRVSVEVTVGDKPPTELGLEALVDFDVRLAMDGAPLNAVEWRKLRESQGNLVLVRGRWVELDREKLESVLAHWEAAAEGELSLREAMRLLAGAPEDGPPPPDVAQWSKVSAGPWLRKALDELRSPDGAFQARGLQGELRPYQEIGARWLSFAAGLQLGVCLADDMGLGKTIQVLAFLLARKRQAPSLLVAPASLLGNWAAEIARFAPGLRVHVAHASGHGVEVDPAGFDLVIVTYAGVSRLDWTLSTEWDAVIVDEAQAIKNPTARQTRAVKGLKSRVRIALTGTPVENRPLDLWSIFDFLNPGLLGSAKSFGRFVKGLDGRGYGPLRELIRPYLLRRLKTDKAIIRDLPEKTEVTAFCGLSRQQAALYQQAIDDLKRTLATVAGIERRGAVLASLMRLKQICNHPSHWLRDGAFEPAASGKFGRLTAIAEEIASRQEKALVFTQFREMTEPLAEHLAGVFGASGLVLHGDTPVKQRQKLVDEFQAGPAPFFVLSTKAGGTGLNLTAASHVIHFDRWWNPAVEDQATDRAFRIGQCKNVLVHKFVCRGTVEEKIDEVLHKKKAVAGELLEGSAEARLTEMSDADLLKTVALDLASALEE